MWLSDKEEGVARKYQEEQLDFYERNWISSRHVIIVEHFMGADPAEDKKLLNKGERHKQPIGERETEWLYSVYPAHRKSPLMI